MRIETNDQPTTPERRHEADPRHLTEGELHTALAHPERLGSKLPDETDTPAQWKQRFSDRQALETFYRDALDRLDQSSEGRQLGQHLPANLTLRDMIETKAERDVPSWVAGMAADLGLKPEAIGRLTHRVAELRTIHRHPDEVLAGTRLVEQRIEDREALNKLSHIEIDTVIQRGEIHYLRDYKPVHLGKFEQTGAGQQWVSQMEVKYGRDFRGQLGRGETTPFGDHRLDKETRAELRAYLSRAVDRHQAQLEKYRTVYAEARGLRPEQVKTAVRPYWVYP